MKKSNLPFEKIFKDRISYKVSIDTNAQGVDFDYDEDASLITASIKYSGFTAIPCWRAIRLLRAKISETLL